MMPSNVDVVYVRLQPTWQMPALSFCVRSACLTILVSVQLCCTIKTLLVLPPKLSWRLPTQFCLSLRQTLFRWISSTYYHWCITRCNCHEHPFCPVAIVHDFANQLDLIESTWRLSSDWWANLVLYLRQDLGLLQHGVWCWWSLLIALHEVTPKFCPTSRSLAQRPLAIRLPTVQLADWCNNPT